MSTAEAAFAANLRALRIAAKMTQAQLAQKMTARGFKWHAATVYKVENNERQIQLGEALAVSEIFDTEIGALTHDGKPAELAEVVEVREDYQQLRHAYATALAQIDALYQCVYAFAVVLAADPEVRQLLPSDELKKMVRDARGAEKVGRKLFAAVGQSPPNPGPMSHHRLGGIKLSMSEALELLERAVSDAEA